MNYLVFKAVLQSMQYKLSKNQEARKRLLFLGQGTGFKANRDSKNFLYANLTNSVLSCIL